MTRAEQYRNRIEHHIFEPGPLPEGEETPPLRVKLLSYGWDYSTRVTRYRESETFIQSHSGRRRKVGHQKVWIRRLREVFEQVDTPDKLEQFLSTCGPFLEPVRPGQKTTQVITWVDFCDWQTFMRDLQQKRSPTVCLDSLRAPVLEALVLDMQAFGLSSLHRGEDPHFEVVSHTALEAIAGTIAVDVLRRVKLSKCDGCPRLYPTETLHLRDANFCSDMCRHRHWQSANPLRKAKSTEVAHGKA